jgi:hypothetical protein
MSIRGGLALDVILNEVEKAMLQMVEANPGNKAKVLKQHAGPILGDVNYANMLAQLHRKGFVELQASAWYLTDLGRQAIGITSPT